MKIYFGLNRQLREEVLGDTAAGTGAASLDDRMASFLAGDDTVEFTKEEADPSLVVGSIVDDPAKIVPPAKSADVKSDIVNNDWFLSSLESELSEEGNEFKLPDEIRTGKTADGKELSQKERFDMLINIMKEEGSDDASASAADIDDPFIKNYLDAKADPNFNQVEWLKNQRHNAEQLDLPSRELMEQTLRAEKGLDGNQRYTDEEIAKYLDGKSQIDIDKEADVVRGRIKTEFEQQQQTIKTQREQEYQNALKEWETNRDKRLGDLTAEMSTLNDIGGIPFSKADQEEYNVVFKELMEVNPKTGQPKIHDILADDKNLYKAIYLLHKADKGQIRSFIGEVKNEVHKKVLSKTSIEPSRRTVSPHSLDAPLSDEDLI